MNKEELIATIKEWERETPGNTEFGMGEKAAFCAVIQHLEAEQELQVKCYEATCVDFDDDGTPIFYGDSKVPDLGLDDKITFRVWWKKED